MNSSEPRQPAGHVGHAHAQHRGHGRAVAGCRAARRPRPRACRSSMRTTPKSAVSARFSACMLMPASAMVRQAAARRPLLVLQENGQLRDHAFFPSLRSMMRFALPSLRSMVFGSTILISTDTCRLLFELGGQAAFKVLELADLVDGEFGDRLHHAARTWSSGPLRGEDDLVLRGDLREAGDDLLDLGREHVHAADDEHVVGAAAQAVDLAVGAPARAGLGDDGA